MYTFFLVIAEMAASPDHQKYLSGDSDSEVDWINVSSHEFVACFGVIHTFLISSQFFSPILISQGMISSPLERLQLRKSIGRSSSSLIIGRTLSTSLNGTWHRKES
jgi:hypothetical protein